MQDLQEHSLSNLHKSGRVNVVTLSPVKIRLWLEVTQAST